MRTDIHATGVELNPPLRAFVEEKTADLDRLVPNQGEVSIKWEVGLPSHHHQSGPVFYAEANLTVGGQLLRAEATNFDLHAAIVDVKDDLKVQIQRLKERLTDKQRQPPAE